MIVNQHLWLIEKQIFEEKICICSIWIRFSVDNDNESFVLVNNTRTINLSLVAWDEILVIMMSLVFPYQFSWRQHASCDN